MSDNLIRENKIKDKYAQLIIDLGFDYDGYSKAKDLKNLIDELVNYAKDILKSNDKKVIYIDDKGKKYNILDEEIGDDDGIYKQI